MAYVSIRMLTFWGAAGRPVAMSVWVLAMLPAFIVASAVTLYSRSGLRVASIGMKELEFVTL